MNIQQICYNHFSWQLLLAPPKGLRLFNFKNTLSMESWFCYQLVFTSPPPLALPLYIMKLWFHWTKCTMESWFRRALVFASIITMEPWFPYILWHPLKTTESLTVLCYQISLRKCDSIYGRGVHSDGCAWQHGDAGGAMWRRWDRVVAQCRGGRWRWWLRDYGGGLGEKKVGW